MVTFVKEREPVAMAENNIIIIGGGISGLIAANELCGQFPVTILEARNELGGRIRSTSLAEGVVVEAGAEFIHGRAPITFELLKRSGIAYRETEGKMYRKVGNQWSGQEEMPGGWNELSKRMKDLQGDITVKEFLRLHYPGDKNKNFREYLVAFAEGFDLADPGKASMRALYKEWSHEGGSYRIPAGYKTLVDFLEEECRNKGCTIITSDAANHIAWQKNKVAVYTAGHREYNCTKLIITLPVGLLSNTPGKTPMSFSPSIDHYLNAFSRLGFGTVVKVVLQFKKPFWKQDTGFVFGNEAIPTWWTQYPLINNLFTGWVGGPQAQRLSLHSDGELLALALRSLSNIYQLPVGTMRNNLLHSFIFNWEKIGESLGGYSYPTTESGKARKLLKTPLDGTLFFTGEGLYDGIYPGTVEAALSAGRKIAVKVQDMLRADI